MTHYSCNPPPPSRPVRRPAGRAGLFPAGADGLDRAGADPDPGDQPGVRPEQPHGRRGPGAFRGATATAATPRRCSLRTPAALAAALPDMPCLIIRSQGVYAFRNKADLEVDADQNPATQDLAGSGTEVGFNSLLGQRPPAPAGPAIHVRPRREPPADGHRRVVRRHGSSFESYIVYGHLALPDNANTPAYHYPGDVAPGGPSAWQNFNPNNYFASQWVLGRSVFLLDPAPPTGTAYYKRSGALNKFSPLSPKTARDHRRAADGLPVRPVRDLDRRLPANRRFRRYPVDPVLAGHDRRRDADHAGPVPGQPAPATPAHQRGRGPGGAVLPPRVHAVHRRVRRRLLLAGPGDRQGELARPGRGRSTTCSTTPGRPTLPVVRKVRWYGFPRDVTDDGNVDARQDVVPLAHFLRDTNTRRWAPWPAHLPRLGTRRAASSVHLDAAGRLLRRGVGPGHAERAPSRR